MTSLSVFLISYLARYSINNAVMRHHLLFSTSFILFTIYSKLIAFKTDDDNSVKSCFDTKRRGAVLSFGRSGSESLLEIIYKATKASVKKPSYEIIGRYKDGHDLENIDPLGVVKKWYREHMRDYPGEIAVFKWKPYCFDEAEYLSVLDYFRSECIPVIYSHRNPLDVHISILKHEQNNDLDAHCYAGDEKCIKAHLNIRLNTSLENLVENIIEKESAHAIIMPSSTPSVS